LLLLSILVTPLPLLLLLFSPSFWL
jgi:hypothetical protein